ncbi:hypothetical protein DFH11DRAFT_1250554 [Phellopilus nigrolimitatus]|nr:hypothetical protein DFH11DRAFT_1250554 [Phellopilus nigrolimitatus]
MEFGSSSNGADAPEIKIFSVEESKSVTLLVIVGVISILAVVIGSVYYFAFAKRSKTYHRTNIAPYLVSLLLANVLQAIATILNARWVRDGIVFDGDFCAFQGGLKNAANVGTALWSFVIAVHVFNLLFLRWRTTRASMVATLVAGWSVVVMIVTLGPLAIETPERGPYFGVSGSWCWITDNYPKEQTYMEYIFEFMSAGLGFILYTLVLLRVRGNLRKDEGRWRVCWIPRSQAWQLCFSRDMLDSAMLCVATSMVWYPVAYSIIIIPVALARLTSFTGHPVPLWAIVVTDAIFNLTGLVNSILFISTRRILPDTASLPRFTTPRSRSMSDSESKYGITPFEVHTASPADTNPAQSNSRKGEDSDEKSDVDIGSMNLPSMGVSHVVSQRVLPATQAHLTPNRRIPTYNVGDHDARPDLDFELGPPVEPEFYTYSRGSITVPALSYGGRTTRPSDMLFSRS